jgi:hypothetical protein
MVTQEQLRRLKIESSEATQLERLRAPESFHPTRRPPPIPSSPGFRTSHEGLSRFSDSDEDALERAFSFTRGASKRYVRHPTASLNCVGGMLSTEVLDHFATERESESPNRMGSRSASAAAASALASESVRQSPTHQLHTYPSEAREYVTPLSKERYNDLKRRGLVPVWKMIKENRKKSTQNTFLKEGTLRRPAGDKKVKKPNRSNTVADPEAVRSKREGTIFFG